MTNAIDLKGRLAYLLVTGASKGIGAKLAIEISRDFAAGSVVVLLARSTSGLEATKAEILQGNGGVTVISKSIDLVKPPVEDLKKILDESIGDKKFDLAMLIHNVGTLGDSSKWAHDIDNYNELETYFSTNAFAPIILNNLFMNAVPKYSKKFIINITSKAAIVPFKSFAFYCSGKAAREMYFRVLAEEDNDVLVLNYSPGPVETDMTVDAQQNSVSEETSGMFKELRSTAKILTTDQTTKRFLEVVAKGAYKSGDHVDYYDEI